MKKNAVALLHGCFWLLFAILSLPGTIGSISNKEMFISFLLSRVWIVIVFYLFYSFLVPKILEKKRVLVFFGLAIGTITIITFVGYLSLLLNRAMFQGSFEGFFKNYNLRLQYSGMEAIAYAALFGTLLRVIVNWFGAMNQKVELEKQNLESEMALLKMQINPHFLFNTLHNIDSLIQKNDTASASDSLIKLSEIMRYMIYDCSTDKVELSKEIDHIKNYLLLQRLRITNQESISFRVNGNANGLLVPPMLFIPFVENAFKHNTSRESDNSVSITFAIEGQRLTFEVVNMNNPQKNMQKDATGGIGLNLVKRRLELLYPSTHSLIIDNSDNKFSVSLIIDKC